MLKGDLQVPTIQWRAIAEEAYNAYGRTTEFKNYQGLDMPKFKDLPHLIQEAWENACLKACQVVNEKFGGME